MINLKLLLIMLYYDTFRFFPKLFNVYNLKSISFLYVVPVKLTLN